MTMRARLVFALSAVARLRAASTPTAGSSRARAGFSEFAAAITERQAAMAALARAADPSATWQEEAHSRGLALVLEDGEVWEKGCISVTVVEEGRLNAARADAISGRTGVDGIVEGAHYSAAALSFVLHARSPRVPTLRGDARMFAVGEHEWFGGGLDLTPAYLVDDDAAHFHRSLKGLCEAHADDGRAVYARMKAACDAYFYLPAREEHRGVGGLFYDDLDAEWAPSFSLALLDCALHADGPYMPVVRARSQEPSTDAQRQWQLLRRGRYIEFNLLYDRGVRFGLSPESIERVLVSSPPLVAWRFRAEPEEGTEEARTLEVLRTPREWA